MTRAARALLAALLLANLVYFIWTQGGLAALGSQPASFSEREPQRMTQQVRPDALQVRPETPAPSAAPPSDTVEDPQHR